VPKENQEIIAAFTKKDKEDVLMLALPSTSGAGHYLVGVCILENQIVIAHECPARIRKKDCWHNDVAHRAFLEKYWWKKELSTYKVVYVTSKIIMAEDWVQIPIPGQSLEFGVDAYEQQHGEYSA